MTPAIALTFVVGVLMVCGPAFNQKLSSAGVILSWLGLVGGVVAILYADFVSVTDAIALSSLGAAGIANVTGQGWKRLSAAIGLAILMVATGASFVTSPLGVNGVQLAVMMGVWASLAAALGMLVSYAAREESVFESAMSLAVGLALAAGAVMVTSRSSLGGWGYFLFLESDAGPLFWTMPGIEKLPDGVRLEVALTLPPWVIIVSVVASVVTCTLPIWRRFAPTKARVALLAASGVMALLTTLAPLQAVTSKVPDAQRYEDYARQAVIRSGEDPQKVSSFGAFNTEGKVRVDRGRHGVDAAVFGIAGLWSVLLMLVALGRLRDETPDAEPTVGFVSRALGFMWLAWMLSGLVHVLLIGTPGMRSPGEWWLTGIAIFATGALVASTRMGDVTRGVVIGLVLGLMAWVLTLNAMFGAYPGLSLGMF